MRIRSFLRDRLPCKGRWVKPIQEEEIPTGSGGAIPHTHPSIPGVSRAPFPTGDTRARAETDIPVDTPGWARAIPLPLWAYLLRAQCPRDQPLHPEPLWTERWLAPASAWICPGRWFLSREHGVAGHRACSTGTYFPNAAPWQGNVGVPGQLPAAPGGTGHTMPPLPGGQWPEGMGGGWAETATGDPWWPEIVPELFEFSAWTETPDGEGFPGWGRNPGPGLCGPAIDLHRHRRHAARGLPRDSTRTPNTSLLPQLISGPWTFRIPWWRRHRPPGARWPRVTPSAGPSSLSRRGNISSPRAGPSPDRNAETSGEHRLGYPGSRPHGRDGPPHSSPAGSPSGLRRGRGPISARGGDHATAFGRGGNRRSDRSGLGGRERERPSAPEIPPIYGAEMAQGGDFATVEVRDGVVGGVRTFTWLVVPLEPGPIRIGPIIFSYFDPYVGDFGQAVYEELTLDVTEFPGGS